MAPDETALRAHLECATFKMGVADGRWRTVGELAWPVLIVMVSAPPREGGPDGFAFRFDLAGYPEHAPTACLWDDVSGILLPAARRPKNPLGNIIHVFRVDWHDGTALYAPFDRVAIAEHGETWAAQFPMSRWTSERDITFVLRRLYAELDTPDYAGI